MTQVSRSPLGGSWQREDPSGDGPLGQGNLESLRSLTEWCKDEIMGMKGRSVAEWFREVVKRNAEMVGLWQVSTVVVSELQRIPRPAVQREASCSAGR
jgi:hypothetical protein